MRTTQQKKGVMLVIEDERPLAEAIRSKLETRNFEVTSARTVEQAFDYLENVAHIDAIWLDHYLLGKENGLDFVAKIKKENGKWKDIPIFVVSNTASADKVQSYMQLGVEQYYVKSDNRLDTIIGEIEKALIDR